MPVYQHLIINDDTYVGSKLKSKVDSDEPWSNTEMQSPFDITETAVNSAEEDEQVDVNPEGDEILVWLSQIDSNLLPLPE